MIDERFSSAAFEAAGLDTREARKLADALAAEIQNQMHGAILASLQTIVDRLNAMGHELQPYGPAVPGDISFRDDKGTGEADDCKLRVAVDTIISTGYSHLIRTRS
jgi:hypothetical protein